MFFFKKNIRKNIYYKVPLEKTKEYTCFYLFIHSFIHLSIYLFNNYLFIYLRTCSFKILIVQCTSIMIFAAIHVTAYSLDRIRHSTYFLVKYHTLHMETSLTHCVFSGILRRMTLLQILIAKDR